MNRKLVIPLLVTASLLAVLLVMNRSDVGQVSAADDAQGRDRPSLRERANPSSASARPPRDAPAREEVSERRRLLESLMDGWSRFEPIHYWEIYQDENARRMEFARHCVRELGLSDELFELSKFLKDHEITVNSSNWSLVSVYLQMVREGELELDGAGLGDFARQHPHLISDPSALGAITGLGVILAEQIEEPERFDVLFKELLELGPQYAQRAAIMFHQSRMRRGELSLDEAMREISVQASLGADPTSRAVFTRLVHAHLLQQEEFDASDAAGIHQLLDEFEGHPFLDRVRVTSDLLYVWARHEPEAALGAVLDDPLRYRPSHAEYVASSGFTKIMGDAGGEVALDWLRGIPEGEYRDSAARGAIVSIFREDPEMAARIADLASPEKAATFKRNFSLGQP